MKLRVLFGMYTTNIVLNICLIIYYSIICKKLKYKEVFFPTLLCIVVQIGLVFGCVYNLNALYFTFKQSCTVVVLLYSWLYIQQVVNLHYIVYNIKVQNVIITPVVMLGCVANPFKTVHYWRKFYLASSILISPVYLVHTIMQKLYTPLDEPRRISTLVCQSILCLLVLFSAVHLLLATKQFAKYQNYINDKIKTLMFIYSLIVIITNSTANIIQLVASLDFFFHIFIDLPENFIYRIEHVIIGSGQLVQCLFQFLLIKTINSELKQHQSDAEPIYNQSQYTNASQ